MSHFFWERTYRSIIRRGCKQKIRDTISSSRKIDEKLQITKKTIKSITSHKVTVIERKVIIVAENEVGLKK